MVGRASSVAATRWATTSEVRRRWLSMSCRLMVEPLSSGKLRMSPSRFLAKTVLPAPMNAILGMVVFSLRCSYRLYPISPQLRVPSCYVNRCFIILSQPRASIPANTSAVTTLGYLSP